MALITCRQSPSITISDKNQCPQQIQLHHGRPVLLLQGYPLPLVVLLTILPWPRPFHCVWSHPFPSTPSLWKQPHRSWVWTWKQVVVTNYFHFLLLLSCPNAPVLDKILLRSPLPFYSVNSVLAILLHEWLNFFGSKWTKLGPGTNQVLPPLIVPTTLQKAEWHLVVPPSPKLLQPHHTTCPYITGNSTLPQCMNSWFPIRLSEFTCIISHYFALTQIVPCG